ncbi:MAG: prepilin-type N-terminal cleavage/methylation domain-containing protein, partial [Candidatus Atribacteria bacterium]|nr:prepilin-type N-terminal cleavage/methylation domain-containing protein [Candidatus Atribacteria bacterium]
MLNKILLRKIKFPLSWRGAFSFCHYRESGNPSSLSLRGALSHVIARKRSDRSNLNLKGFSLIELMVAAAILSLAIFGIFQAFSTGFLGMFDARDRTIATNYIQEKMEELKNADFDTVGDEVSSQIVGDIKFSRNVDVEYIDGSTNLIVAGPTNLKRVTTTVNWTDRNGVAKKVESSMLLQNTQFTPGDPARISLYADPYNVVLPITDSTTIIAVIKDKSGNTIFDWDGSDVTFTITSGDSLGTLSDYAVPPVQGRANVILTSSGTGPSAPEGTIIIEASVTTADGLNTFIDTIVVDVTWGAVKIELIPNPSSIYANGSSQSTITAIIENAAGG